MLNDDEPTGTILTRRQAVALLGTAGLTVLGARYASGQPFRRKHAGAVGSVCVVRPQQTEGPYFVDEKLHRADIRNDPSDGKLTPGTPLDLAFNVSRVVNGQCIALAGAVVDIWQCDNAGVYSDVRDPQFDTRGKKFLRGYQVTDARGMARFVTIYPGWYQGRAVHIHFKVRSAPNVSPGFEFTSQVYFDEALTDVVHAAAPYQKTGTRTRNERDGIFRREGGTALLLDVARKGDGYTSVFNVAVA
jgi:protocatechuate 3,4-dioxygenase beta subunit